MKKWSLKFGIASGLEIGSLYLVETVSHPHELWDVGLCIEVFSDGPLARFQVKTFWLIQIFYFCRSKIFATVFMYHGFSLPVGQITAKNLVYFAYWGKSKFFVENLKWNSLLKHVFFSFTRICFWIWEGNAV